MATDLEKLVVQLSADIKGYEREMRKAVGVTNRQAREIEKRFNAMNRNLDGIGKRAARSLVAPFAGIAAAIGGRELIRMTGEWTDLTSRVNLAAGSMEKGNQVMQRVSDMARRTYSDLSQTAEGYLAFSTTLTELGVSTDRQLDFVESLNNALVVSGAKGDTAARVMDALSKATREGWLGEAPVYLLSRQGRTEAINSELRAHVVGDDNRTIESPAGDILTALPQPQVFATREAPDEHQLQISFPQGLQLATGESGVAIRVPLRIRARRVGDVGWRNLPELHFQQRQLGQIRATIRFAWTDDPSGAPAAASGSGWVEARRFAPGQTALPAAEDWTADPYFGTSGPDYLDAGNAGTTGVQHVQMDRWTATLLLDRAGWPPGRYEFEIVRGAAFKVADYAASSYQYGGSVWDFFGRRGTPGQIVMSRDNVVDSLYLLRSVSIWDEHPLPSRDLAVIAIRARNRAADRLSVLASGWVRDWDGTGWRDWTTTSNPAPHLVDVWTGMLNVDPVPDGLIWHDRLLDWRAHCAAEGYTVDAIIEDRSVDDVARLVASCGYAEPYMSDQWGVVYDRDTSAEAPVQVFTGRNSQGFGWSKGFARMPDGLRVNFAEQVRDYEPRQISVFRPGLSNDNGRVEQVDYPGLVDYDAVHRRALYDQAQAIHRSTFYNLTAPAEYLLSRRGDLVGIQHQALSEWAGSARVAAVQLDGNGDTVAILPDTPLTISQRPYMDQVPNLAAEDRLDLLGLRMGLAIRAGGNVAIHDAMQDGDWIDLAPPAPGDITGALVVVGASGRVYRRVRIMDIEPGDDLTARITAVDEAPQIWSMLHG